MPESLQCFGNAEKDSKTSRSGFDLSASAAGEFPPQEIQCGRDGICMGDCPRCLPDIQKFGGLQTCRVGARPSVGPDESGIDPPQQSKEEG